MNGYALEADLPQRPIAALPVLTPWLAGHWVNLVTPIPRRSRVPMVESLQFDCVMKDHAVDGSSRRRRRGSCGYRARSRSPSEAGARRGRDQLANAEVAGAHQRSAAERSRLDRAHRVRRPGGSPRTRRIAAVVA